MGSIPACAGEPRCGTSGTEMRTAVYPRVCGGTRFDDSSFATLGLRGLSRACAGEPVMLDRSGPLA